LVARDTFVITGFLPAFAQFVFVEQQPCAVAYPTEFHELSSPGTP